MTAHPRIALAALTGAAAVAFVDLTAVSVALPSIQRQTGATSGLVQWVMTAYLVAVAVAVAAGGRIADLIGPRRAFLIGLACFAGASTLAGLSPDVGWLIAARVAQGLAAALLLPASQALAVEAFGPERLGRALGIILGLSSVALIAGPLAGGALVELFDWRAVFFVNLPVTAAIGAAAIWAFAPRSRVRAGTGLDPLGCLLVAGSAGTLVIAASGIGPAALGLAALGGLLAVALVRHERRAEHPLLDPSSLREPAFAGSLAAVFLLQFAPIALIVYGSIYLQDAVGLGALETGIAVLPATLSFLLASLAGGRLSDRIGAKAPATAGAALIAAALALVALLAAEREYAPLVPALIAFGIGLGLCAAPINAALLARKPATSAGSTAGLIATARQLGSALAAAALGAAALLGEREHLGAERGDSVGRALDSHDAGALADLPSGALDQLREAIAAGTATAMWIAAAITVLAAALSLRYVPRHREPGDDRAA